jgi:S-formylglutathione hydrolase FrmB
MEITNDTRPIDILELSPYMNLLMYKCTPVDRPAGDDTTVDPKNSRHLKKLLDQHGIPAELEIAEFGGHGWGDGSGSGAAGWPYRAIHFLETL